MSTTAEKRLQEEALLNKLRNAAQIAGAAEAAKLRQDQAFLWEQAQKAAVGQAASETVISAVGPQDNAKETSSDAQKADEFIYIQSASLNISRATAAQKESMKAIANYFATQSQVKHGWSNERTEKAADDLSTIFINTFQHAADASKQPIPQLQANADKNGAAAKLTPTPKKTIAKEASKEIIPSQAKLDRLSDKIDHSTDANQFADEAIFNDGQLDRNQISDLKYVINTAIDKFYEQIQYTSQDVQTIANDHGRSIEVGVTSLIYAQTIPSFRPGPRFFDSSRLKRAEEDYMGYMFRNTNMSENLCNFLVSCAMGDTGPLIEQTAQMKLQLEMDKIANNGLIYK